MQLLRICSLLDGKDKFGKIMHRLVQAMPVELVSPDGDPEAIFCRNDEPGLKAALDLAAKGDRLVYASECADGAQICCRHQLRNPAVRLLKMYCAYPAAVHTMATSCRRLHVRLLDPGSVKLSNSPSDEEYSRVRLGPSFLHMPHISALLQDLTGPIPDWNARDIDLMLVGTMDYGTAAIAAHRQKALEDVLQAGSRYRTLAKAGRPYGKCEWTSILRRTRIVVSPWGNGEPCYRDYEGIMAGCRVLKPTTPYRIDSTCGLFSKPYDAMTYVQPMDMLAGVDLDGLLHSGPDLAARQQLLERQPATWMGKYLADMCAGDRYD